MIEFHKANLSKNKKGNSPDIRQIARSRNTRPPRSAVAVSDSGHPDTASLTWHSPLGGVVTLGKDCTGFVDRSDHDRGTNLPLTLRPPLAETGRLIDFFKVRCAQLPLQFDTGIKENPQALDFPCRHVICRSPTFAAERKLHQSEIAQTHGMTVHQIIG